MYTTKKDPVSHERPYWQVPGWSSEASVGWSGPSTLEKVHLSELSFFTVSNSLFQLYSPRKYFCFLIFVSDRLIWKNLTELDWKCLDFLAITQPFSTCSCFVKKNQEVNGYNKRFTTCILRQCDGWRKASSVLTTSLGEGNVFTVVCLLFCWRGPMWPLPMIHWDGYPTHPCYSHLVVTFGDMRPTHCSWHLVAITGDLLKLVSFEDLPPSPLSVLISSSDHQNTYSWQAGGTHLTGMLSCLTREFESNENCSYINRTTFYELVAMASTE